MNSSDEPREPRESEPKLAGGSEVGSKPTSDGGSETRPLPWWTRPGDRPVDGATEAGPAGAETQSSGETTSAAGDEVSGPGRFADPWTVPTEPLAGYGPAEKAARRKGLRQTAALTAAAVVVSAAVTGTVVHFVDDGSHSPGTVASSTAVSKLPAAANVSSSVKTALNKIQPSVVLINDTVTSSPSGRGGFGGFGGFQESGAGTGIIISSDGLVVTNAHVVNGATNIKVTLPNNGGTHDASIVGIDTGHDLAVVKVSGVSGLTAATFANSDTVQVGDSVIAVGNALGYGGSPTVTEGIISAKSRSLQDSSDNLSGLLQTDAAINPGNSGGPLVDVNGDVVGINVAVATGSSSEPAQNIGFSIPSNTVVSQLPALKAGENANSQGGSGTTQTAAFLGVSVADAGNGALVEAVQSGSPADTAGVRQGDVITAVDGTSISSGSDLQQAIRSKKPGTTVTLTLTRNSSSTTVKVKLGSTQVSS